MRISDSYLILRLARVQGVYEKAVKGRMVKVPSRVLRLHRMKQKLLQTLALQHGLKKSDYDI